MEENNNNQGGGGGQQQQQHGGGGSAETVRSRWTPKPEQILILESIFNSGMVNPPKEETVRIRKLLEKFGAVGDANVFYWFQNRRSRCRRRQRQLQASLQAASSAAGDAQANMAGYHHHNYHQPSSTGGGSSSGGGATIQYDGGSIMGSCGSGASGATIPPATSYSYFLTGQSAEEESLFSLSSNPITLTGSSGIILSSSPPSDIIMPCSSTATPEASDFLYQTSAGEGYITVFINGIATQVPRGPLDVRSMFGDVSLLHSSGLSLPVNDYGFLLPGLHPGESYFLVSRQA